MKLKKLTAIIFLAVFLPAMSQNGFIKTFIKQGRFEKLRKNCIESAESGSSIILQAEIISPEEAFSRWHVHYSLYSGGDDEEEIRENASWANYLRKKIYKYYCPDIKESKRLPILILPVEK
ncbi:MAG: hypothetical protein MUD12_06825 [Spirochaetes bacterium]|jgi:hypothetical protein|nr:hypothetical protein [Spirochaetota bacterium]